MLAEADFCASEFGRLGWAWGCWTASLRTSGAMSSIVYAAALLSGLGLMTAYEWSADEGRMTVVVLGLIATSLGALHPRQAVLSGASVGLVVTCVIGFEAASGIRPAYETGSQTLLHSLHWTILLAPALSSAVLGAHVRRRLQPGLSP